MASEMAEAIRQLVEEKGISKDLVRKTIEETLLAAYTRYYGTGENAVIRFKGDLESVDLYAKKIIVEEIEDPVLEISLVEAQKLAEGAELGDILEIPIDTQQFDLKTVMLAKQTSRQSFRMISHDTQYTDYKSKIGEIIIGYYQREKNGNIYVDLGKAEGIFPKKYQSPKESYNQGERIKALIVDVVLDSNNVSIVLSRTHAEFVQKILELEVPELYDSIIEVFKIVREPGYRTKIAVLSHNEDVDPVGACVGIKGVRIQSIIRELEGEKIDILKYDIDPKKFISNALSPAEVKEVYILDEAKHQALAVVPENQFSVAIGKQGLNVRLANRLCDWNIDVKTEEQFAQLDRPSVLKQAVTDLFSESDAKRGVLAALKGFNQEWALPLAEAGIFTREEFLTRLSEEPIDIPQLSDTQIEQIKTWLSELPEDVSAEADLAPQSASEGGEVYNCPDCNAVITTEMTNCPKCGVELSFEYED